MSDEKLTAESETMVIGGGEDLWLESNCTIDAGFTEPPKGRCSAHGEQRDVRIIGLGGGDIVLGCGECLAEMLLSRVEDFRKSTGRTWEPPE